MGTSEITENQIEQPKKRSKGAVIAALIIAGVLIIAGIILAAPYIIRQINIKKNMSEVYTRAFFEHVRVDLKPVSNETLEKQYFKGKELLDEDLYSFIIEDSEGRNGWGYCTKSGEVICDNYAGQYYQEESMLYFQNTAQMEKNFPDLEFCVLGTSPDNRGRFVLTKECGTFEGYLHSSMTGNCSISGAGYPVVWVMVKTDDRETLYDVNRILRKADFEMYVRYFEMLDDFDEENLKGFGSGVGSFCPHGASYQVAVLGDYSSIEPREGEGPLLTIEVSSFGSPYESYIVDYDGSFVWRVYTSETEYTEQKAVLTEEDYRTIYMASHAMEYDTNHTTIMSNYQPEDYYYKVCVYIIYPAKTVGRELYNVDREPEEIVPVRILLRSYFD